MNAFKTILLSGLIAIANFLCSADPLPVPDAISFTNKAGEIVSNAKVIRNTGNEIFYELPGGGSRVKLADLPASIQHDFHYTAPIREASTNVEQAVIINDGTIQSSFSNALKKIHIPPGVYQRRDMQIQINKIPELHDDAMRELDHRLEDAIGQDAVWRIEIVKDKEAFSFKGDLTFRIREARKVRDDLDDAAAEKQIQLMKDFSAQLIRSANSSPRQLGEK